MRHLLLFAALPILVLLLSGCTPNSKTPTPSTASFCKFLDKKAELTISPLKAIEGHNGELMTSQILLQNKSHHTAKLFIRAKFYDKAGREVESTFGHWNWKSILSKEQSSFSAVAPNPTVTKIVFEIRSANPDATVRPGRR